MKLKAFVRRASTLVVAGLLASACFAQQTSAVRKPAAKAAVKHPKIEPQQECSDCHEDEFNQWQSSRHGLNQVKCLVCHGSVQENFIAKPSPARCEACHDQKFAQLKSDPFMKGKSCFTCHPPHTLRPHPTAASEATDEHF